MLTSGSFKWSPGRPTWSAVWTLVLTWYQSLGIPHGEGASHAEDAAIEDGGGAAEDHHADDGDGEDEYYNCHIWEGLGGRKILSDSSLAKLVSSIHGIL